MLAPWKAGRDARARLIAAKGEVEVQRILAEGRADTMQIIATAQADARSALISPDAVSQGEVAIADIVSQRIQFQEEKRQANIGSVVRKAVVQLGSREVQEHEVDHDWTARFFSDVQDVSSEEMQQLWAKILAGEVERPGSTSIKTLGILRNLNESTANLFQTLCSACLSASLDGESIFEARVASLGGNPSQNSLSDYGLFYSNLNLLNEHGLVVSDYDSWCDYNMCIEPWPTRSAPGMQYIPFRFQGKFWVLSPTTDRDPGNEYKLSGVALTQSGMELSRVIELTPTEAYAQALAEFFQREHLRLKEVEDWQLFTIR